MTNQAHTHAHENQRQQIAGIGKRFFVPSVVCLLTFSFTVKMSLLGFANDWHTRKTQINTFIKILSKCNFVTLALPHPLISSIRLIRLEDCVYATGKEAVDEKTRSHTSQTAHWIQKPHYSNRFRSKPEKIRCDSFQNVPLSRCDCICER